MKKILTDEVIDLIVKLYEEGNHNCVTLSKKFDVSRDTIVYWLKKRGVVVKKKQFDFRKPKCKEGDIYITKEGYEALVVKVTSSKDIDILIDGYLMKKISQGSLLKGEIKNRNKRAVFGVGYIGYGEYSAKTNNKLNVSYSRWLGILKRCYYESYIIDNPSYKGCSVAEEWHNFQNFAKWFEENWKPWMDSSWQIDKDILIKGNKIYSPETCCFVPHQINNLYLKSNCKNKEMPLGVIKKGKRFVAQIRLDGIVIIIGYYDTKEEAFQAYKIKKEEWIRSIILQWKDKISLNVYNTLLNYSIEITD